MSSELKGLSRYDAEMAIQRWQKRAAMQIQSWMSQGLRKRLEDKVWGRIKVGISVIIKIERPVINTGANLIGVSGRYKRPVGTIGKQEFL